MTTELKKESEILTEDKFNTKEYKRSRAAYMAECTFEYFVDILVADAFLAKLLTHIGLSDAMTGIISSFITLAFLFQLLSIFVARKIVNTKKVAVTFHVLSQLLFLSLYTIPFMPFSTGVKTAMVVVCVLIAYISKYLVSTVIFKWANSYVNPAKRARFSAVKEMISLFMGIIYTLVVGMIVDKFEAIGNISGGFIFISITIFTLSICDFVSLMAIKNQIRDVKREKEPPFKEVIKDIMGNRNYLNLILMTILWDIARYMTVGFLGVFKTKDLLLSVGTIQIINIISNFVRLSVSLPLGKFSDKHSYATGIKVGYMIVALGFFVNMFTTPQRWWCIVVYTILYSVSLAATNQNSFNISYSYVKAEYFVPAGAIKNSIGGIFGFAASFVGSRILAAIQANGNTFMGMHVYGQQVLSAISFVVMVITILFIHFVIEKQEVLVQ